MNPEDHKAMEILTALSHAANNTPLPSNSSKLTAASPATAPLPSSSNNSPSSSRASSSSLQHLMPLPTSPIETYTASLTLQQLQQKLQRRITQALQDYHSEVEKLREQQQHHGHNHTHNSTAQLQSPILASRNLQQQTVEEPFNKTAQEEQESLFQDALRYEDEVNENHEASVLDTSFLFDNNASHLQDVEQETTDDDDNETSELNTSFTLIKPSTMTLSELEALVQQQLYVLCAQLGLKKYGRKQLVAWRVFCKSHQNDTMSKQFYEYKNKMKRMSESEFKRLESKYPSKEKRHRVKIYDIARYFVLQQLDFDTLVAAALKTPITTVKLEQSSSNDSNNRNTSLLHFNFEELQELRKQQLKAECVKRNLKLFGSKKLIAMRLYISMHPHCKDKTMLSSSIASLKSIFQTKAEELKRLARRANLEHVNFNDQTELIEALAFEMLQQDNGTFAEIRAQIELLKASKTSTKT